jgi:hypothetical protein
MISLASAYCQARPVCLDGEKVYMMCSVENFLPTVLCDYFLMYNKMFMSYQQKAVLKLCFNGYFSNMTAQAHFIESIDVLFSQLTF